MSAEVLSLLQDDPSLNMTEEELPGPHTPPADALPGYRWAVDQASLTGHKYWEGYYHALPADNSIKSQCPRDGQIMNKLAAPKVLRAFILAARKKIEPHLEQHVFSHLRAKASPTPFIAAILQLYDQGAFLSDLAVQIHKGTAVGKPHMGWHADDIVSLMHMAISVRGHRTLHARLAKHEKARNARRVIEWQEPGDVYVSSPHLFDHAVEYPRMPEWDDRCVAIQARILVTPKQNHDLHEAEGVDPDGAFEFTRLLAGALDAMNAVGLPSLGEVNKAMAELSD